MNPEENQLADDLVLLEAAQNVLKYIPGGLDAIRKIVRGQA